MRLDRTVTLALSAGPFRRVISGGGRAHLPVLMYHSISTDEERTPVYFRTVTHPTVFARQMELLKREGYVGVTLSQGLEWLRSPAADGPKPVAITFDDGFRDFQEAAVPVLTRHRFKATIYLATGFVHDDRRRLMNRDCLSWREVASLHASGFEFGSHTITHPRLVELGWQEIRSELVESKAAIEEHLQSRVTAFAYPYAFPQERTDFVRRFNDMLREAGYQTCVTTKIGRAGTGDDWLRLPRLPVNSCDDDNLLRAKLEGHYDWLATAQSLIRKAKRFSARMIGGGAPGAVTPSQPSR